MTGHVGEGSAESPAARPWPHGRRFEITYHDVDALNHLNHAAYFPFMETLRCDYYLPLLSTHDPRELDIILAEASCRFLAPAGYGTVMVGEVAPGSPLGRTSFTLLYRFTAPGDPTTVYARGRTVVVCYDYAKAQKKPIEPSVRARLERDAVPIESEGWARG
ncbi:MAG: acyl-CoA thioesterase [Thermoplasmata archaeon]|nr:acyl-CoA thioesterase [Thermoplasmata archaeon]